jgi:hypothetical protein
VVYFSAAKDAENAMIYLNGGQIDGATITVVDTPPVKAVDAAQTFITKNSNNGKNSVKVRSARETAQVADPNNAKSDAGTAQGRKRNRDVDTAARDYSTQARPGRQVEAASIKPAKAEPKYVPKDRTQETTRPERAPAREGGRRGTSRSRSTSRRRQPVLVDADRTRRDNIEQGRRQNPGSDRQRVNSRDRGRALNAQTSHYGPAAAAPQRNAPVGSRRGSQAAAPSGVYGPAGGGRYVPMDRGGRGRSPVRRSPDSRGGRMAPYMPQRGRRASRSRSPKRSGYRDGRGRSPSRSPSPRRARRSESRSSSRSVAGRRPRYSRSPSRSSRSSSVGRRRGRYSRSRSSSSYSGAGQAGRRRRASYSSSRSRSASGRGRSRSSSSGSRAGRGGTRSRSPSYSRSRSRSPARARSQSSDA